jgi:hypothetical protein
VVDGDLLANGGGLLVGDLLLGDRRTGRSIDTPYLGVVSLAAVAWYGQILIHRRSDSDNYSPTQIILQHTNRMATHMFLDIDGRQIRFYYLIKISAVRMPRNFVRITIFRSH